MAEVGDQNDVLQQEATFAKGQHATLQQELAAAKAKCAEMMQELQLCNDTIAGLTGAAQKAGNPA